MENSQPNQESASLRFLYHTAVGRFLLKPLTSRTISKLCGCFLDSGLSKYLIKSFIKKNHIDMSEYQKETYSCFNDCFCRRILPECRPIDADPLALIAPCDGYLSAYRLHDLSIIPAKQSLYTVSSLLAGDAVSEKYRNGICLVFRLCVNHYHRYCYIDDGHKGDNHFISGKLHTVRPIALSQSPVFCENCREYTVLQTEHFGFVTQVEVGALLVGKIHNEHESAAIQKGEEKGHFLYGGSTIILLLEKDAVKIPDSFFSQTDIGNEIPVKMGQRLNII